MPPTPKRAQGKKWPIPDLAGFLLVLVLMVGVWLLTGGVATAVYRSYEPLGEPSTSLGPRGLGEGAPQGPYGFFWSERAFHYRTVLLLSGGRDWGFDPVAQLDHDTFQQYPDGVDAWAEYTLLMEPVYAQLYRWFARDGEIPATFLLRLIPLIHALLLPLIFLVARGLGIRPLPALLAVLVYATAAMGYARWTGSLLLKENFALIWLMLWLAGHFRHLHTRAWGSLVVACLGLFLLLVSWHLGQVLALVPLVLTGLLAALPSGNPGQTAPFGSRYLPPAYLAVCLAAAFTPSLAARGFFLGLPVFAALAWGTVVWLRSRGAVCRPPLPVGIWAGVLALGLVAGHFNPFLAGDYDHVSGLLLQKLRHAFVRPEDPTSLPFAVRVFWAPPFTSPGVAGIWSKLGWHSPVLVSAGVVLARAGLRRRLSRPATLLALIAGAYLLAWLLIERLGVVFWPVAAVLVGLAAQEVMPRGIGRRLVPGVLVLAAAVNLATGMRPHVQMATRVHQGQGVRLETDDGQTSLFRAELFDWLRRETAGPGFPGRSTPAGGILTDIGLSPQVLLYSRRPIVLNSQFENAPIRERYQRFLEALYGTDPAALEEILQETRTAYFILPRTWALGDGPGSLTWQAGHQGPVHLEQLVARLHFHPETLNFLQPVYDNEYYRVFRHGTPDVGPLAWESRGSPWWDLRSFTIADGTLAHSREDRRRLSETEQRWQELQAQQHRILGRMGRPDLGRLVQQRVGLALRALPGQDGGARLAEADRLLDARLERRDPRTGRPFRHSLEALLDGVGTEPGMRELLADRPAGPVAHASTAQLLAMVGRYQEAAASMKKAIGLHPVRPQRRALDGRPLRRTDPMTSRLRQEYVMWLLLAGENGAAREESRRFLPLEAPSSPAADFYRQVLGSQEP